MANPYDAGACTSRRKVQATASTEGDVEGRLGGKGSAARVWAGREGGREGRRPSRAKRRDEDGARGETERGRNTCSRRVHAFQGFRESGEYDGGDVSLNI